jgi:hypothetical protein
MVTKRLLAALALACCALLARAAWLPLQLDMPKRDNPVDPYNPENLKKLYSQATALATLTPIPVATATATQTPCPLCTPTPTPTFCVCTPTFTPTWSPTLCVGCAAAVIASYPANGSTIEVPYDPKSDSASIAPYVIRVVFYFNQNMDPTTFNAPMAVTISPTVSFSVYAEGSNSLIVYLLTIKNYASDIPARLNTNYIITLGSAIKTVAGQSLAPYSLNFTTGPFRLVRFGNGKGTLSRFACYFNGILNTSMNPAAALSISPGGYNGWSYVSNGEIQFQMCDIKPSTDYTLSYTGGLSDINGNFAPATTLSARSEPLRVSSISGAPYGFSINFNYPMDITATANQISISPVGWQEQYGYNNCSYGYSAGGVSLRHNANYPTGNYTVTVGAGAKTLSGVFLGAPVTYNIYIP